MPGLPVHVHCIGDAIQPSHPLVSSSPSALNLSLRSFLKYRASGNLLYDAGDSNLVLCGNLEGWDGARGGREIEEGRDIGVPMADSC